MKNNLMKYHPGALRKYISEHNRRIRKDIGGEIKSQRVKYNQFLKVKREELKKEQTINTKGLKKEGLVNAILKSPVIMRAIKSDKERKKPFFDGFEFKNDSLQPIKKQAKQTEKKQTEKKQTEKETEKKVEPKADPKISKIEKQMKRSNIIGKVKALGQKQVIKKKALAQKIENTAKELKKNKLKHKHRHRNHRHQKRKYR